MISSTFSLLAFVSNTQTYLEEARSLTFRGIRVYMIRISCLLTEGHDLSGYLSSLLFYRCAICFVFCFTGVHSVVLNFIWHEDNAMAS